MNMDKLGGNLNACTPVAKETSFNALMPIVINKVSYYFRKTKRDALRHLFYFN